MSEKMILCFNQENGHLVEHPESVTRDHALMLRMGLRVKPEAYKLSTKEVLVSIKDAKTVDGIDLIMDGETRQPCIDAAEEKKNKLNK